MKVEIWRDIKEDRVLYYQVSNFGRVKRLEHYSSGRLIPEKTIKVYEHKRSKVVSLRYPNGKKKEVAISTLLKKAFSKEEIRNPAELPEELKVNQKQYIYKEKNYNTIKELTNLTNVSYPTLNARKHRGWSVEEIIEIPTLPKNIKTKVKLYKYNNKLYSFKQLWKQAVISIKYITFKDRIIKLKWSIEEALTIPVSIKKKGVKKENGL